MFKKRDSCSVSGTGIKQYDNKPKTYLIQQQEIPQQIDDVQLEKIEKRQKRKSKYQRDDK
jgi:hypothetical protein